MSTNSESQCYFVQLQIDSFIDGELSQAQQEVFTSHVHGCEDCGRELHYAQTVHDTVLDLPAIDCDENVLEPIDRLVNNGHTVQSPRVSSSLWTQLQDWIVGAPIFVRYALPVAAFAILALAIWPALFNPQQETPLVATQTSNELEADYSAEDIQQALLDLNLAIDYLNDVSQRTEVMIGDRFLVTPLQDSLNASFERASERNRNGLQDDPI
ncbi:MAG: hypothetical protein GKR91_04350 [Pseudomonadales bacterium]|nr:hypothetical protein [Pseudomonadales bacterium]